MPVDFGSKQDVYFTSLAELNEFEYILLNTESIIWEQMLTLGLNGGYSDDPDISKKFIFLYHRCLNEAM